MGWGFGGLEGVGPGVVCVTLAPSVVLQWLGFAEPGGSQRLGPARDRGDAEYDWRRHRDTVPSL